MEKNIIKCPACGDNPKIWKNRKTGNFRITEPKEAIHNYIHLFCRCCNGNGFIAKGVYRESGLVSGDYFYMKEGK